MERENDAERDEKDKKKKATTTTTSPTTSSGTGVKLKTMALNDTKAGMEGLDKESINNIINQASKNSKFYEHKLKQQKEIEKKVAEMKAKLQSFSAATLRDSELEMDKFGEQLEKSRDYSRFIVHIDMDMFFAAVEMRDVPALRDKPMAVGSSKMLCTSNYAARRFGVRAAMPGFIGQKLCPKLIIVPPNFEKYTAVSAQVKEVLKEFDPDFIMGSLDEAYLDITAFVESTERDPEEVVSDLRAKIFEKTQLTASAGLASNGFLAKLAGEVNKPNGQTFIPKTAEDEAKFVNDLPIRKVNGIGGTTELMLKGLGIHTCKEIWEKRAILNLLFKPITAHRLIQISKGYQESYQDWASYAEGDRKSISCDITLEKGTSDVETFCSVLEKIAEDLASQLESRQMRCKSVVLKIKTVDFAVNSRSTNLFSYTNKAADIYNAAKGILEGYVREAKNKSPEGKLSLRLLGIRVCKWESKREAPDNHSSSSHCGEHEPPSKQLKIEEAFAKLINKKVDSNKTITSTRTSSSSNSESDSGAIINKKPLYDCPACSESFPSEAAVEIHLDNCNGLYVSPAVSQQTSDVNTVCSENQIPECKNNSVKAGINCDSDVEEVVMVPVKKFTCPVCFKEVQSLVENIEIASSDHVNFCISASENEQSPFNASEHGTWRLYTTE